MNLITRSDFDGIACAVLLKQVEIVENIRFAEPKEVQDRLIEVGPGDILANLPFHPDCGMWFDHHSSEVERTHFESDFEGRFELAPSAARVIYNHYKSHRFHRYEYLLAEVDRIDSAQLSVWDVTDPDGWVLVSYLLDPRTGLTAYEGPGVTNEDFPFRMVDLMTERTASEILQMRDIRLRVRKYFEQEQAFREILENNSRLEGRVVITDTRGISPLPTGNRFLIYTMFPHANLSIRLFDGEDGFHTGVAIGKSIFNKTSFTNVGDLCEKFGGGGHEGAGAVRFSPEEADEKTARILKFIQSDD